MEGNDQADRLAGKATLTSGLIASLKIRSVEELETLPAGIKPGTPQPWTQILSTEFVAEIIPSTWTVVGLLSSSSFFLFSFLIHFF